VLMIRVFPILALLVAACAAPSLASAQVTADTGTIFVAAAGFADMRRAPTAEVQNGPDDDASGTAAGGALTLGVHLTPRLSVRAEWSLSDTLSLDRNTGVASTSLLVPQQTTEERDIKAGFALLGYHLGAGRASVELLAGLGLVNERVTTITEIQLPVFPRVPNYRNEYSTSSHHPVAVVGADAAVSLTTHAALVPQVRVFAVNGALQVRPGLGLRWTF
jgi:hypothetical protein